MVALLRELSVLSLIYGHQTLLQHRIRIHGRNRLVCYANVSVSKVFFLMLFFCGGWWRPWGGGPPYRNPRLEQLRRLNAPSDIQPQSTLLRYSPRATRPTPSSGAGTDRSRTATGPALSARA